MNRIISNTRHEKCLQQQYTEEEIWYIGEGGSSWYFKDSNRLIWRAKNFYFKLEKASTFFLLLKSYVHKKKKLLGAWVGWVTVLEFFV